MQSVHRNQRLTRDTFLAFNLAGDSDSVQCLGCRKILKLPFPFVPHKEMIKGKLVDIKSKKQMVRNFLEQHYAACIQGKK